MNDVVRRAHLLSTQPQLPVQAYFDENLFRREMAMFERQARYVGHRLWVPEAGDWRTLAHEDNARVLVHGREGVQLLSNVCRHRQALILGGHAGAVTAGPAHGRLSPQSGGHIVCPLHRWTYTDTGELVGAPPNAPNSMSRAMRWTASKPTIAATTGRPSSRSTWRTTTSAPSTPAWAAS